MTETILDLLRIRADAISKKGVELLQKYSGMHPVNLPGDGVFFISASGDHYWNMLPPEGKMIQAELLPAIDRFSELIRTLIRNLPTAAQREVDGMLKTLRSSVEQEHTTWWKTREEAVAGFRALGSKIIDTLGSYCDNSTNEVYAIADTNALIQNPDIENWQFLNIDHFTLILTPTILAELDSHKVNHKNPQVRDKASSLIRKIKEYRRRGALSDGVVVVKGRVSLRSVASEPKMDQSLSWLDANNADDRFLASAIEVMRASLGRKAFIVTSDINLQNKAEVAGVPFCEVPPMIEQGG